ncbi:preprotein translocase subunit SecY [Candidatus Portiera aleyrodidarum]|uniref:preprotein translocase subunit SecY n=1 Tax=Candidatus Portiera aleyrodidarum TaxID=91844 RepID=UPI0011BD057D|nr:preprotein translocase subunit SecY [Candidatus Portiera aleyrodidarum]
MISKIYQDIIKKMRFILVAIIIYRIGVHITVPGVDCFKVHNFIQANSAISLFNMFSGGAFERLSIFSIGLMPYISASIIMQVITGMFLDVEVSKHKLTSYLRYLTLMLSVIHSLVVSILFLEKSVVYYKKSVVYLTIILTFVTGAIFLMWLGEQITDKGIGNGISLIILSGLVSVIPNALGRTLFLTIKDSSWMYIQILKVVILVLITIILVVVIESGQIRIKVSYPRRLIGKKLYATQSSYLPLKLNMAGVIPAIFASRSLIITASVGQWINRSILPQLSPGQPLYIMFFVLSVIFYSFFYTAIVLNAKEVSINLKKSGAFIHGMRPGKQTAGFISKVSSRLNWFGAIYIVFFSLIPQLIMVYCKIPFGGGGISILIMVVVVLDFLSQIQSYLTAN